MITAEKRTVSRTGMAAYGWQLGYGYVHRSATVKSDVWCVVEDGKVIAECRGEKQAKRIVKAMEGNNE